MSVDSESRYVLGFNCMVGESITYVVNYGDAEWEFSRSINSAKLFGLDFIMGFMGMRIKSGFDTPRVWDVHTYEEITDIILVMAA